MFALTSNECSSLICYFEGRHFDRSFFFFFFAFFRIIHHHFDLFLIFIFFSLRVFFMASVRHFIVQQKDMQFVHFNEMRMYETHNNNRKNRWLKESRRTAGEWGWKKYQGNGNAIGKQNGRSISLFYSCCNNILFSVLFVEIEIFCTFPRNSQLRAYCVSLTIVKWFDIVNSLMRLLSSCKRTNCHWKGVNFSINELIFNGKNEPSSEERHACFNGMGLRLCRLNLNELRCFFGLIKTSKEYDNRRINKCIYRHSHK